MNANWCYLVRCGWQWEHIKQDETRHDCLCLLMEYTAQNIRIRIGIECRAKATIAEDQATIDEQQCQPNQRCHRDAMTDVNQISFIYFISLSFFPFWLVFIFLLVACSFFHWHLIRFNCCDVQKRLFRLRWRLCHANALEHTWIREIWFIYYGLPRDSHVRMIFNLNDSQDECFVSAALDFRLKEDKKGFSGKILRNMVTDMKVSPLQKIKQNKRFSVT